MWGAAMHDRATGVHRPLEATLLWMEPIHSEDSATRVLVTLDHCILDTCEMNLIRQSICDATGIAIDNILVSLSHTHGAGWMSRTRSHLPGGELLGPYLDRLALQLAELARQAASKVVPATIVYGHSRCDLAAHRDFLDESFGKYVCGLNPDGSADDFVLLARVCDESGKSLATLVNYACHPTTLAWGNTLISPDWVGAMREVIEKHEGSPCLFLQGASGDLGPREGFVADPAIADRNGRQLGFAVMSGLTALPSPGTEYKYCGPVISGTAIGTWSHRPQTEVAFEKQATWRWKKIVVELPYRHDLPTVEGTNSELLFWSDEELKAKQVHDEERTRECRAKIEQCTRQLNRLHHLVPGPIFPLTVHLGLVGDAIWVLVPGELYQDFQRLLRARFATYPVVIGTLTNDWQPGYIPPARSYGYGIYQEAIAATAAGCLEVLGENIGRELEAMLRGM